MSSSKYESLEHSADTGFLVKAPSLERLFIQAGLALTDHFVAVDNIKEESTRSVAVSAEDRDDLMVNWLNEILFLFEQYKFLCHRIIFTAFDGKNIEATLFGEAYEPMRHGPTSEIKAVTYHQLELGDSDESHPYFYARIFLDI